MPNKHEIGFISPPPEETPTQTPAQDSTYLTYSDLLEALFHSTHSPEDFYLCVEYLTAYFQGQLSEPSRQISTESWRTIPSTRLFLERMEPLQEQEEYAEQAANTTFPLDASEPICRGTGPLPQSWGMA